MSDKCVQCGNCCNYTLSDGTKWKCEHLVKLKNRSICRIYKTHEGTKLRNGMVCIRREGNEDLECYANCPVLKEEKNGLYKSS